jgi:hypothetical protein
VNDIRTHAVAQALADRLETHYDIVCETWPMGLFVAGGLCVYVGRLTGVYRWFEDAVPMDHPVDDPFGCAERIATRHGRMLEAARYAVG